MPATVKPIYLDIQVDGSPLSDILRVEVNGGYKQATSRFTMEVRDVSGISLNDPITIDLGYTTSYGQVFDGYIDTITATRRPGVYEISGRDIIKRAIEHWIVTNNLDEPWKRENISAEALVGALLAEAGLTNYSYDTSSFTFGVSNPVEFNIISSWDAIERILNILAWRCYAEGDTVYFKDLQPVPGTPIKTISAGTSGTITSINYDVSTDNLRNRVVIFGREGIYAEASQATSYDPRTATYEQLLPTDFYKTAIVSSEMIDLQSMADQAAQYNLDLYNRLTEAVRMDVEGDYELLPRKTITASEAFSGVTGDWFIYSATHRIDNNGYITTLHLTR